MSIQRARIQRRKKGFVQIDNAVVRDTRVSLRARGMLAWLLSQPDDFHFSVETWASENRDGEPAYLGGRNKDADLRESDNAIRAGMQELKAGGYIARFKRRREDGTFEWFLYIREDVTESWDFESVDNPSEDEPRLGLTSDNTANFQVTPHKDQPPVAQTRIYRNTNKEVNTEYANYGRLAIEKDRALKQGLGCTDCDTVGVVEHDDGLWDQCRTCQGAGVVQKVSA